MKPEYKPRRPLDDHRPDLYLESDNDYFGNNRELILMLLEPYEKNFIVGDKNDLQETQTSTNLAVMSNEVTKLLDDIERILKKTKRTIADLARDLDKNYNQVYHWIKVRRFAPGGNAMLRLKEWRDINHVRSL